MSSKFIEEIRLRNEERRKPLQKLSPYYTQREWNRIVGYGEVPKKHRIENENE